MKQNRTDKSHAIYRSGSVSFPWTRSRCLLSVKPRLNFGLSKPCFLLLLIQARPLVYILQKILVTICRVILYSNSLWIQSQKTQGFCVADFATPSDDRRLRSKIILLVNTNKITCVRKSEGLTSSKILGFCKLNYLKGNSGRKKSLTQMKEREKCKEISHQWPQCTKWFSRYPISNSGIWARWTSPFCRFLSSFSIKYDVTDAILQDIEKETVLYLRSILFHLFEIL